MKCRVPPFLQDDEHMMWHLIFPALLVYWHVITPLDRWINGNTECLSYLLWVKASLRKTEIKARLKSTCAWLHSSSSILLSSLCWWNIHSLVCYTDSRGRCLSICLSCAHPTSADSKPPGVLKKQIQEYALPSSFRFRAISGLTNKAKLLLFFFK